MGFAPRGSILMFGVAVLMATLVAMPSARAEDITVNAVSFFDIPKDTPMVVETFNDSEQNLALKQRFETELKAQGYEVTDNARLILSFDVSDESGTWTGGGPNRLIELKNRDDHTGTDAPNVRLNIFDSNRGGLLNPKRDPGITEVAPSQLRIDVSIEDRDNGRRLWQGWSMANISAANDTVLQRALVKPMIDNIGKTVRDATIPLN